MMKQQDLEILMYDVCVLQNGWKKHLPEPNAFSLLRMFLAKVT